MTPEIRRLARVRRRAIARSNRRKYAWLRGLRRELVIEAVRLDRAIEERLLALLPGRIPFGLDHPYVKKHPERYQRWPVRKVA